jgi:hypothetical protein
MLDTQPTIDPHHHLWDLKRNKNPWLQERPLAPRLEGDIQPMAKDYLIEDYLADIRNQNVAKSVHVECGWDSSDPVGETEWLQWLADKHGYPHGIVARATLDALDVEQVLEGHARHKNIRGIRHAINWHPDPAKTYVDRPDLIRTKAWRHGFGLPDGLACLLIFSFIPLRWPTPPRSLTRTPTSLSSLTTLGCLSIATRKVFVFGIAACGNWLLLRMSWSRSLG